MSDLQVVPAEARRFQGRPAGIVTRVVANAIDLATAVVVAGAIYLAWACALFLRHGRSFTFPTVSSPIAITVLLVALAAIFALAWATSGQTYGDRVLGLRVQRVDGGPVGRVRALVRAIICVALPLLLFWAAISRDRRSVQDLLVGTSVVYDWGPAVRHPSGDAIGPGVDVAAAITHEPNERQPEPVGGLDREG
ncbi:MAG TPA: RDD family protein [Actinomycetota bacterium]|nr:RDD family protein [Actinomycetota bacterium]